MPNYLKYKPTSYSPRAGAELLEGDFLEHIREGTNPRKPLQEQHPEVDRTKIMNFSAQPETAVRYLENQGFEAQQYGPGLRISVRRPGERLWRVVDPDTGFFSADLFRDIGDVLGEGATAFGMAGGMTAATALTGGAALAPMMIGGALGGAGTEALKQGLAKAGGLDPTLGEAASRIAEEGVLGATGPVFEKGLGAAYKAVKPHLGRARAALKTKLAPYTAEDLAQMPDEALRDLALERGVPGARGYSQAEREAMAAQRPSLSKTEALKAQSDLKAEYLRGVTTYDREHIPSILEQRLRNPPAELMRYVDEGAITRQEMEEIVRRQVTSELKAAQATIAQRIEGAPISEVPETATRLQLVRDILARQPGAQIKQRLSRGLRRAGDIAQAPSRFIGRAFDRLLPSQYSLEQSAVTVGEREKAVRGLEQFLEDRLTREGTRPAQVMTGGTAEDIARREALGTMARVRQRLAERPRKAFGESIPLKGTEIRDLYDDVFAAIRQTPEYLKEAKAQNLGDILRRELRSKYLVPPEYKMGPREKGLSVDYFAALRKYPEATAAAFSSRVRPFALPIIAGRVGGWGLRKGASRLMASAEPLNRILASQTAPSSIKKIASSAMESFARGDRAGYRAAIYVLLSRASARRLLEAPSGE